MAALFSAQQGGKNTAGYESLGEGEQYLNDLLRRGGMLQQQAQGAQAAGQRAMQQIPAKPSVAEMLMKGGINILKDPKARGEITGMLGKGWDWMTGADTRDWFGDADFSFGF